jgi:hypothetical protein
MDYGSLDASQITNLAVFGRPTTIASNTALVVNGYGASYVSDLQLDTVKNGYGAIGINTAPLGSPLMVGGFAYAKGISVYGSSQVDVTLGGAYDTFQADVGLDGSAGAGAAVTYQVWGDGVLLYTSPLMTSAADYLPITVDVTGRDVLSLRTIASGGAAVIADWGAARLSSAPADSAGALTWRVGVDGTVVSTTADASFVLRPSETGVYTIEATDTVNGITRRSSTRLNVD